MIGIVASCGGEVRSGASFDGVDGGLDAAASQAEPSAAPDPGSLLPRDAGSSPLQDSSSLPPSDAGSSGARIDGGAACAAQVFDPVGRPVDLYIMLDKSSSMLEPLDPVDPTDTVDRWTATVAALKRFAEDPGAAAARVGLQYFGLPDACDVEGYATPEVPIDDLSNNASAIVTSIESHFPSTLTPMGQAVQGALQHMKEWAADEPGRTHAVVLVADGYPTECEPRLTGIHRLVTEAVEEDPRVSTFVIGIGGVPNLDRIAHAGGTGRAFLIHSGDLEQQLLDALLAIARTPLGCDWEVPEPAGWALDPELVAVFFETGRAGAAEEVPRVEHAGACALSDRGGWYYGGSGSTPRIVACPSTCAAVAERGVEIRLGCVAARGGR